uniref:Ribonuclease P protein component 2 n=2 Tax=Staphylothermus marinus TaxID=2280 RepID=A0A7C4D9F8_STAMA
MNETITYILLSLLIVLTILYLILYLKLRSKLSLLNRIVRGIIIKESSSEKINKIRKRYIVFSIISNSSFNKQLLEKTIRDSYRKYFGEISLIQADPQLIYFDYSLQRGIIRTTNLHKNSVVITLSLIREINSSKCLIIPLKTTGTIKKARRILYKLHRDVAKT